MDNIAVIPLKVLWGKRVFRDGIDITPRASTSCSKRLRPTPPPAPPPTANSSTSTPAWRATATWCRCTSRPSCRRPGRRRTGLRERQRAPARSAPGGTSAADLDRRQSLGEPGLGLLALFAARMAERGQSATAIAARLESIRDRMPAMFVVDTLRVPGARRAHRQGPCPAGRAPRHQADPRRRGRRDRVGRQGARRPPGPAAHDRALRRQDRSPGPRSAASSTPTPRSGPTA